MQTQAAPESAGQVEPENLCFFNYTWVTPQTLSGRVIIVMIIINLFSIYQMKKWGSSVWMACLCLHSPGFKRSPQPGLLQAVEIVIWL